MLLRMQMEALREVKGQSVWDMMKLTDKWGAKRKRKLLLSRREEEQIQWVVEGDRQGVWGLQRERGSYSLGEEKSRQRGLWG